MGTSRFDVVVVGGGPAGLSAGLVLGRARRKVLLCDSGTPRSWATKKMHSFLTRDGIAPARFRRIAHEELSRYQTVTLRSAEVTGAARRKQGEFRVTMAGHAPVVCRKLLIATGVFDHLPKIEGIEKFFGTTVFQCPYCDGWEMRGAPVAVYGKRQRGFEMARAMTAWTSDITLCTDGPSKLSASAKTHLRRNGIRLIEKRIARLEGKRGQFEATSVPGVFVAGNIIKDVQLAIVAAAEGTRAAFGINVALTREDFTRKATGSKRVEHPSIEDPAMKLRRAKHA